MKRHLSALLAVFVIIALIWVGKGFYQNIGIDKKQQGVERVVAVQTVRAKEVDLQERFDTVANIEAKYFVELSNAFAGKVEQIHYKSGSYVKKDQILVNLIPNSTVKAPFSGYITDWQIKEGSFVNVGTPLVQLVNKDILAVSYYVPEQFADKLELEQLAEIRVRAFPTEVFTGKVTYISPIVEPKNHSILVRVELINSGLKLIPGSFAEVSHILVTAQPSVVLPDSCLHQTLAGYQVYKVEEGKLVKISVVPGRYYQSRVQILHGIVAADQVLLTHAPGLVEGKLVVATDWDGDW